MTTVNDTLSRIDGPYVARIVTMILLPVPPVAALIAGNAVLPFLASGIVFVAVALLSRRLEPASQPLVLSLVLIGQCIAFTASLANHPWQIDSHMLFFGMLAIIATLSSIPALLAAVALTAVHHLSLGLLLPALVFPVAGMLDAVERVLFHAVIVILEAAVLLWSMVHSARAKAEIEAGRARLEETAAEAAEARASAEKAREKAVAAASNTRIEGRRAASAVEQIATSARATAENARNVQATVAETQGEATRSSDVVKRAIGAMTEIEKSSEQIRQIITMIDEIARQTDLLALNAAVEAARAGEAGRGFAVVATEVRELAKRSADAAQQIRSLVTTSSGQVVEGVDLVGETGEVLKRIVTAVTEIDTLMRGIATSAEEQSEGLNDVTCAIARIDSITDEEETADDADFIAEASDRTGTSRNRAFMTDTLAVPAAA
ncbi:hypothetical protein DKT77_06490 [Meridianimarinicoccus roseus]|uniref:Methyl-accepting transducer domain-containing protein n=1 Tax=Meridianimarinicoccus roseus TaxID=2072018 RepID=A0A2V2LMH8_9RHOB|nr:methyl-accepting chemotaxis protein [Meridianimarinicoccus roseus]PWR03499.1 hypothetical protein DKT77_06490 [Meridianimarinicoccus roseus]